MADLVGEEPTVQGIPSGPTAGLWRAHRMFVHERVLERAVVLECRGRMTLSTAHRLTAAVQSIHASCATPHLVIDLSETTFMDSTGLAALLRAFKETEATGGRLRVAGVTGQVQHLLGRTNLATLLRPHATVDEALALCEPVTGWPHREPAAAARRYLRVADIMGMVEVDAYDVEVDEPELGRRCAAAAELGAATLLCRPEHVGIAAELMAGSGVSVGAAAGLFGRPPGVAPLGELLHEAAEITAAGGQQVAMVVQWDTLAPEAVEALAERVRQVVAAAAPSVVKVILESHTSHAEALVCAARTAADAGAGVVSAGSWRQGARASLRHIRPMRQALGSKAMLKWSNHLTDLDRLLLAHAEGVERFRADIDAIHAQALRREVDGRIRVPVADVDYQWSGPLNDGEVPARRP